MNVFQLIKLILDDEYADMAQTTAETDLIVQERLKELSTNYRQLATIAPSHDYGDPSTRLAYMFRYVTSHTHLVAGELAACGKLRDLLAKDRVLVSCVGGGPGSDFLGLLQYLINESWQGTLRAYLLDGEAGWGDTWSDVGERLKGMPFDIYSHFQQLDVTDAESWEKQRKYLKADLFTFVYFISEIIALGDKAEPFFEHLFSTAKPGALFLFIDNQDAGRNRFVDWFSGLALRRGLEEVYTQTHDARLPGSEEKHDLEPYLRRLGGSPKLTARVECRVFRKPES